jgi:hypothetical protein
MSSSTEYIFLLLTLKLVFGLFFGWWAVGLVGRWAGGLVGWWAVGLVGWWAESDLCPGL